MTADRREHKRKTCAKTTFFATKDKLFQGLVKNISFGGVYIESSDAFSPGDMLTLAVPCSSNEEGKKLKEPFNDEDVKMKCKVIWQNQGGIGMEFIKPYA
jgi:hypothetical protein